MMIEDELRAAFARHEEKIPDLSVLRRAIDRAAAKRRCRNHVGVPAGAAALLVIVSMLVLPFLADRQSSFADSGVTASASTTGSIDVLLLGLDDDGNADSVTLVHVPRDRSSIQLIALPRDLLIEELPPTGGSGKLNATHRTGGPALTRTVVESVTGLHLDGAIAVKLSSVGPLVDGLGGVRVCLPNQVPSLHRPGVTYPSGCAEYSGADAADLVRQRKGLPMGAYERDRNTQRVAMGVWAKVAGADRVRLARLLVAADVTVDGDLLDLAMGLRRIGPSNVVGLGAPRFNPVSIDGVVYERLDPDAAAVFAALRDDTVGAFAAAHPEWVTPIER